MPIRVLINGAQGKMGSLAKITLENHPEFEVVAGLGHQDNLRQGIMDTHAEVVVDLTRADVAYQNTRTIIERGAHPVIGTSGLLEAQIQELTQFAQAQELGGIIVPNFSIAAVLMMRFAAQAAHFLPDVEIIEAHHPQKYEAPSGTAMKTAELISQARTKRACVDEETQAASHELLTGALGANYQGVRIHSLRLPGVLAQQQVVFGNLGETLSITHNSLDRACFMPGLILCCRKVKHLNTLHYGLESLLD